MVPPVSHGVSRVPRYSGYNLLSILFAYGALTLYGRPSQTIRLSMLTNVAVRNPEDIATFGLASSDFARHYFRNLG